jgi:hypothetical protein
MIAHQNSGLLSTSQTCPHEAVKFNADDHGIVTDGFDLKIAGDTQFPCIILLASRSRSTKVDR